MTSHAKVMIFYVGERERPDKKWALLVTKTTQKHFEMVKGGYLI